MHRGYFLSEISKFIMLKNLIPLFEYCNFVCTENGCHSAFDSYQNNGSTAGKINST